MDDAHIIVCEADVGTIGRGQLAVAEHPGRLFIPPDTALRAHDPLVGRGAHGERADPLDELGISHRAVKIDVLLQQPVK